MQTGSSQSIPDLPQPRLSGVDFSTGEDGSAIRYLSDETLFEACGVRIAFFERTGGVSVAPFDSLDLGSHVGDDPLAVDENRRRALEACGGAHLASGLIVPNQVHGCEIAVFEDGGGAAFMEQVSDAAPQDAEARNALMPDVDAVFTDEVRVPVLLCFADCTPVILVAPGGAFVVIHAGWKGALGGIAGKSAALLFDKTGSSPTAVNAYIGPHIGACCYDTSREILAEFCEKYGEGCDAGQGRLSLSAAVSSDLLAAGLSPERICDCGLCTSCDTERFFSYRAEGGKTGRIGALALRFEQ